MEMIMRLNIVQIGNSRGLRLPKALLEQCGIKNSVNIEVENHSLIITPILSPRKGWDEAFLKMSNKKDDYLLDAEDEAHSWEKEEWVW